MRITAKVVFDWSGAVLERESFEYTGPLALCDRKTSKQIAQQGIANSAEDQSNATGALAATNKSLTDYKSNLAKFMDFGRSTYGADGEFAKDQNTIANTTAAAGSKALGGRLALDAMRTGDNTANFAPAAAEAQRQGERDLTGQLAGADATRLQQLSNINQFGVTASALPAQVQASLYGTSLGGSNSSLGVGQQASAADKSFTDTLPDDLTAAIGAAGTAAAGFCPCEGSLIRMADGSDKPVEQLRKGDWIWAMGTLSPPNEVISDPVAIEQESWEVFTNDGLHHRGSDTHTLALAAGGYVCMPDAKGRAVIGEWGGSLVVEAAAIGKQKVYPFKVGGSHCYMADGICVLA